MFTQLLSSEKKATLSLCRFSRWPRYSCPQVQMSHSHAPSTSHPHSPLPTPPSTPTTPWPLALLSPTTPPPTPPPPFIPGLPMVIRFQASGIASKAEKGQDQTNPLTDNNNNSYRLTSGFLVRVGEHFNGCLYLHRKIFTTVVCRGFVLCSAGFPWTALCGDVSRIRWNFAPYGCVS